MEEKPNFLEPPPPPALDSDGPFFERRESERFMVNKEELFEAAQVCVGNVSTGS